jgi:hypothetical protein
MLPMQADPMLEWQRLTEHYRAMSDDELRELAADFNDLTETAQQALRSEMRSRGIGDPIETSTAPVPSNVPLNASTVRNTSAPIHDRAVDTLGFFNRQPELVPDLPDAGAEPNGPVEYTWKTLLCECDSSQEATELSEALKRAGIECWIEGPKRSAYSAYASLDLTNPRVLVAADQLDQARAIAAGPIPAEIIAESRVKIPDFTPPSCPKCGAPDPILEGVDPVNSWECEQCGQKWTDPTPEESIKADSSPAHPRINGKSRPATGQLSPQGE